MDLPAISPSLDDGAFMPSVLHSLVVLFIKPWTLVPAGQAAELRQVLKERGIIIRTNPECGLPTARPDLGTVYLGWPFCERVWAYVYAGLSIISWDENRRHQASIGFFQDQTYEPALKLLNWVIASETMPGRTVWPADAPRPPVPPSTPGRLLVSMANAEYMRSPAILNTFEGRVTEVFLRVVGWFLLHEIGHIVLGHYEFDPQDSRAQVDSLMQEQEADAFAVEWALGQTKSRRPEKLSLIAIVNAFIILVSGHLMPIYRERRPGEVTHPDSPTRLRRFLKTYCQRQKYPWRLASLLLELHLRAQGRSVPQGIALGTDEHICRAFELMGGRVLRSRRR